MSDLYWLSRHDKDILPPPVIYEDIDASGECYWPRHTTVQIGEHEHSLHRGLIVINPKTIIPSALAHEWRHLWQFYNVRPLGNSNWSKHARRKTYQEAIVSYFVNDPAEYDALLFELKHYPVDHNREWYEWILKRGTS